jgi:3-phosphoshikimate 1-carboxyvinyltransferase
MDDLDDPWLVLGSGGSLLPPAVAIDAQEAGTVARFLAAVAMLVPGSVTIDGRGRMRERPMAELIAALEGLGAALTHRQGRLPLTIEGGRLRGGMVPVDASRSSQFVTALLLVAPMAETPTEIVLTKPPTSRPYLLSTLEVMGAFGASVETYEDRFLVLASGYRSTHYQIEADASAAVYPLVAAAITGGKVVVEGIPVESTQADLGLLQVLEAMGCRIRRGSNHIELEGPAGKLAAIEVELGDSPDGALALAVACLFANGTSRLQGLASLRHKESDRLAALETELNRVGGEARVEGDCLVVTPGTLRPATVETYGDHRMAMSMALVGLVQPGIIIDSPSCVTKTWPDYFTMLAHL